MQIGGWKIHRLRVDAAMAKVCVGCCFRERAPQGCQGGPQRQEDETEAEKGEAQGSLAWRVWSGGGSLLWHGFCDVQLPTGSGTGADRWTYQVNAPMAT